ncbi:MAG: EAL domain-containing protein [Lachnospiraceae bacterium]|jgi:diguanylate cyclase (GGDEF)-like protein
MFKQVKKDRSIFVYLFSAMSILTLIGIMILTGSLTIGGMYEKLNQNAKDIIDQKVINRSSYVQNEMNGKWADLSAPAANINEIAERLDAEGVIRFETLDKNSEEAAPLIMETVEELISIMRTRQVTGAYLIFNTHDLDAGIEDKPGIYLRDLDPLSRESAGNADILLERAPAEVVKALNIATDSSWQPRFEFKKTETPYYDFFYTPYQQAASNEKGYAAEDMGYWGGKYRLKGVNYDAFTYSIPLINSEGLVYGVLGIDITLDYLKKLLPSYELLEDENSSYMLAINKEEGNVIQSVAVHGELEAMDLSTVELNQVGNDYYLDENGQTFYASMQYLNIYNNNTPYSNHKWSLIGMVDTKELFLFTDKVRSTFMVAVLMTLAVGIVGSYFFSYLISKPIRRLIKEVGKAKMKEQVRFSQTRIKEIDQFARTMEQLNQNIVDTSMKFTNLLQMASVKLAGFEYNEETCELFLSDNYFEIFLDRQTEASELSLDQFKRKMKEYEKYIVSSDYDKKGYLFQIPDEENFIYVNMRLLKKGSIHTGVVENVTDTVIEKRVIEYERDHDALTGLLNRGAFVRMINELFSLHKDQLKTAALLMLDLDNLKYLNDNYGHEVGDNYIAKAGRVFVEQVPKQTVVSRISGDEFYLFFYGYENETEIEKRILELKREIDAATITVMDQEFQITASGGVAWYPKDSTSFEKLQHFADYAMYKIKHTSKGTLTNFDRDEYMRDSIKREAKEELKSMITNKTLQFYFQPIISSRTGKIFAYEALMRSFMPSLKFPLDILKIAKEENCLGAIEELTWELSLESFARHKNCRLVDSDTRIFINSIANQILSQEKIRELEEKYPEYLSNIVLEVTESEWANEEHQQQKAELMKKWNGKIALDDYGSGYNGDRMLLMTVPEFIKIDMEIIRDIDSNPDKCKIVENIIGYAHERGMKVIAEGIETIGELKQVIKLHVDYLQGYLFSKPQYLPPRIQEEMVQLIQFLNE